MKTLESLDLSFRRAVVPYLTRLNTGGIEYSITSTRRTKEYQARLKALGYPVSLEDSNHLTGRALDLWIKNTPQRKKAALWGRLSGFRVIEYGKTPKRDLSGLLHIDFGKKAGQKNPAKKGLLFKAALIGALIYGLKHFKRP